MKKEKDNKNKASVHIAKTVHSVQYLKVKWMQTKNVVEELATFY